MEKRTKQLNKAIALLITVVALLAAGTINGYYVNEHLGALGGLVVDMLGLYVIIEAWRRTMKPKVKPSDKIER